MLAFNFMETSPSGEIRIAGVSGVIEIEVLSCCETLVASGLPAANNPPNMAHVTATTAMVTATVMKPRVNLG